MIIVLLYYLIFVAFSIKTAKDSNGRENVRAQIVLTFLLLFIFFGFRDLSVLNDSSHYYADVRDLIASRSSLHVFEIDNFSRIEPGFQIYIKILASVFDNPYCIIFISALLTTVANISLFKKWNPESVFFCITLLLCYQLPLQYSAIRQGMATAICYYSITQLMEGKWVKFIVATLLASTFHITAVMVLLLLPLNYVPINRRSIILSIIALVVVLRYLVYPLVGVFSSDDTYIDTNTGRTFPLASLIIVIITCGLLYISYRIKCNYKINKGSRLYWWIFILTIYVGIVDVYFPIIGRINMYFLPFAISLFARQVFYLPSKVKRINIVQLVCIVYFLRFIIMLIFKNGWFNLYPYSFMDISDIYMGYEIHEYD